MICVEFLIFQIKQAEANLRPLSLFGAGGATVTQTFCAISKPFLDILPDGTAAQRLASPPLWVGICQSVGSGDLHV